MPWRRRAEPALGIEARRVGEMARVERVGPHQADDEGARRDVDVADGGVGIACDGSSGATGFRRIVSLMQAST